MASEAATAGQPIKAIQAQLGHRSAQSTEVYAHLGSSAQLRLVKALAPASPPHPSQYLVNEVKEGSWGIRRQTLSAADVHRMQSS
jgi:hypothetical protein